MKKSAILIISFLSVAIIANAQPTGCWSDEGNYDTSWFDDHAEADTFYISSAAQLAGLAVIRNAIEHDNVYFRTKTIFLTTNIDLGAHYWEPIGYKSEASGFSGTFDGQDFVISNLTIDVTNR